MAQSKNVCIRLDENLIRKITENGKYNINKAVEMRLGEYLDAKRDTISELSTLLSCKDFVYLCELLEDVDMQRLQYREILLEYVYADRDLNLRRDIDVLFIIENLKRMSKEVFRTLIECIEFFGRLTDEERKELGERKESFSLFFELTPCLYS